jgi:cold shock CspA family protein
MLETNRGGIDMHGVIVRLDPEGKYGFIESEDGQEFFFHLTGLSGVEFEQLTVGSEVDFSIASRQPGDEPGEDRRAVHVQLGEGAVAVIANEPLPPEKLE